MFTDKSKNSLPETVTVGKYTVYKLKLKQYPDALKVIQRIQPKLSKYFSTDNTETVSNIPSMILDAYDEVIELIAMVTGESKEEIEDNVDLPMATQIVEEAIRINGFLELYSKAQKNVQQK